MRFGYIPGSLRARDGPDRKIEMTLEIDQIDSEKEARKCVSEAIACFDKGLVSMYRLCELGMEMMDIKEIPTLSDAGFKSDAEELKELMWMAYRFADQANNTVN